MYDTDKNGFLDQEEMDSIIDQMMTVAEYTGWETQELRPVSNQLGTLYMNMPRHCAGNAGMRAVGSLQRSYLILPSRGPHLLITVPPSSHVVNLLHIVFPLIVTHAPAML